MVKCNGGPIYVWAAMVDSETRRPIRVVRCLPHSPSRTTANPLRFLLKLREMPLWMPRPSSPTGVIGSVTLGDSREPGFQNHVY